MTQEAVKPREERVGEEINRDSKGETVETGSRATRRRDSKG